MGSKAIDPGRLKRFVGKIWDESILPTLIDYIRIPNKSPAFDPDWAVHGYMDQAVDLFEAWARASIDGIAGATLDVVRLPGRTPLVLVDIPGAGQDTVLLYGHLDKQPEMTGWEEGYGPWVPRLEGDRLYGRGGADDGYAMFAALSAILALRDQELSHARCVILIEACEESGSYDLPYYVDHLASRIGNPSLVICLDSGCGDYERLWVTTSLRGMIAGSLTVRVLDEAVHSGDASGTIPSSFRIIRSLVSRLEDEMTGVILPPSLHSVIPPERIAQAHQVAALIGEEAHSKFPHAAGMSPLSDDPVELVLNRTWRPQLSVTGAEGLLSLADAGNVLRPFTALKLSLRLPPTVDGGEAWELVKTLLEDRPPYGATVEFALDQASTGWDAPALSPWLEECLSTASDSVFGAKPAFAGEGGSIPFIGMLSERFPQAQFVVTGVLGPHSNAHGPNEFLHVPTGKRVSAVIAHVLKAHSERPDG